MVVARYLQFQSIIALTITYFIGNSVIYACGLSYIMEVIRKNRKHKEQFRYYLILFDYIESCDHILRALAILWIWLTTT